MNDSQPSDLADSAPPLPNLPPPPPARWQFSLAAIMLFTLACAVAAAVVRLWRGWPWLQGLSLGLTVALLLYVFWRLRTVSLRWGRWNEIQRHRQDLAAWADRARASRHTAGGQHPGPSDADDS